jgi:hypothetical protein
MSSFFASALGQWGINRQVQHGLGTPVTAGLDAAGLYASGLSLEALALVSAENGFTA